MAERAIRYARKAWYGNSLMESSLFIAVKAPTSQHRKNLVWMLSEDAPIFEEEVPQKWRAMFNAVEELAPDEVIPVGSDIAILNWLCGDWDDAFRNYSPALVDGGFAKQSAYYWADEDEGYLIVNETEVSLAKPASNKEKTSVELTLPKKWSVEDKKIARHLVDLLNL